MSQFDDRAMKGIRGALEYLARRELLYKEWNEVHDSSMPDDYKHAQLAKIDRRTECLERDAVCQLHDLLFYLGFKEKPIAR